MMQNNIFYLRCLKTCTLVAFIALPALPGTSAQAESFTPVRALRQALESNRELQLVSRIVDQAEARFRWAGQRANPLLELSANRDWPGENDGEGTYDLAVRQSFPLTSRLRDEKHLRRLEIDLARAEVAEARRQLAGRVEAAVIRQLARQRKVELLKQQAELNQSLADFLGKRAALGEVSPLDVTQATLTVRLLERRIATLQAEADRGRLELHHLLGLDHDAEVKFSGELTLPESLLPPGANWEELLHARPDAVLAREGVQVAEAALRLEKEKKYEDISVGLLVSGNRAVDEPEGLDDNTYIGVGVSIPLPFRRANQTQLATAEVAWKAAEARRQVLEHHIVIELKQAQLNRDLAYQLARESSGDVLALAEKNLKDFQTAHQQGQASLLQVQRAQEQVLELQTAAHEAAADYHLAEAELRMVLNDFQF